MKIVFEQSYWGVVLLIGLLLAAGITMLTYYRNKDIGELTDWQKRTLISLRFLAVFFLSILFTVPLIKSLKRITELPTIVIAVDNSASMKGLPGTSDQTETVEALSSDIRKRLEDQFSVVTYSFGERTRREGVLDFSEKWSDYSQMLGTIFSNHFNQNTGALVILGDGNYNQGENPANRLDMISYPVYALGTGDTSAIKDARIAGIKVNKTAFSGNQFPVEADIRLTGLANSALEFSIFHEKEKIFSKEINPAGEDFFVTVPVTLDAAGKGLQTYTAVIETAKGEQNVTNNRWTFIMHILENKQKILILSTGSHPDIGAIKSALEQQINYKVVIHTSEPFPDNIRDYNLLVLNQLPTSTQSCGQLLEQSAKSRIPLLIIIGSKTMLPQLNAWGLGVEIMPLAGEFDEAQVSLNSGFASFTMSNDLKNILNKFPPLKVPFAQYKLGIEYREIAFQRVKNIVTSRPLIATGTIHGVKTGIIFGEGIWRWRLYNYQASGNHLEFNEFMDRLVQYLALRDNEDNFIVDFKPVYQETENILMSAEVYNDAYELINTPEVTVTLADSIRREYLYTFDRGAGYYYLDAGIFPPGRYQFTASTKIGSKDYAESGEFIIIPVNIEQINYQANHQLLYRLSHETKGEFFTLDEAEALINTIKKNNSIKPVNYLQTMLKELLNLKWIFVILLILLSSEWFLRKFWGIY